MTGSSLIKLIVLLLLCIKLICIPLLLLLLLFAIVSMWAHNADYGDVHMRGWLYVQYVQLGNWLCCITWHVQDVMAAVFPDDPPCYHWEAHLWDWWPGYGWKHDMIMSLGIDCISGEPYVMHSGQQMLRVDSWMIHR